jgi:hypothetical protein
VNLSTGGEVNQGGSTIAADGEGPAAHPERTYRRSPRAILARNIDI